jgi:Ca2+-binding RTX toxin-like protein
MDHSNGSRHIQVGDNGNNTLRGTHMDDKLEGRGGNDTLIGNGGSDVLQGGGGDDYLSVLGASGMAGVYGQDGNDILIGSIVGRGQIHMNGGTGNDRFILDLTNDAGRQGHHVYGGRDNDTFEFTNTDKINARVLGRIDDFDVSRDSIKVEGRLLDMKNLPDDIRVVSWQGQQWLSIDNKALYALEGARDGGLEQHFQDLPGNIANLKTVAFIDQKNFVPDHMVNESALNLIERRDSDTHITGTGGDDWIVDEVLTRTNGGNVTIDAGGRITAGNGNDVVDAGKGDDTVYGGSGHDKIAGGVDEDRLYGEGGNDILFGGSESDRLDGGSGHDRLYGGTGDDSLYGGGNNDVLVGDDGDDYMSAHWGHDRMWGGNGNDRMYGGNGNDQMYGQSGNDYLDGGGLNDRIHGNDGNDGLIGGSGSDSLYGGNGNDWIRGGEGKDIAYGGAGADAFVFYKGDMVNWGDLSGSVADRNSQLDRIADFDAGVDRIKFYESTGVDGMEDLMFWKTNLDGDIHFTVKVRGTDDRILVNVDDDMSWGAFSDADNFAFG